ncbi:B3 DNA binding domain [Arabidopsis suecica]|uniref:B3 DNA binding domain n=1 Tax=Arabidopsis suecica TaxID=45249 RepID=A0A8T2BB55_ARASU|nr:B3 DNA binding domain [Arabidopsis suecica]
MSSMYHDEVHLTASGKNLWSNFCVLVDAAVMLYEEEQRRKTVSDEEAESQKRIFCLFPRKTRSSLVKRQQKLNGFLTSTSSSLIDLNQFPTDSETEQNHLHMAESEKTETKDPLNPNVPCSLSLCLTENTSRKRRAVEQRKRIRVKKAKVVPFSGTARETPEWLVKVMSDMKEAKDAKLIFEKTLFVTDVNPTQNRLSMPFNNLLRNNFLTSVESRIIDKDINNDKKIGVGAILVDQRSEKWGVMLKRWEMKKESGKGSWNYNLICGWNDVVEANGLKDGDNISLWSFRCCGILCFAMEQSSSSLALCLC